MKKLSKLLALLLALAMVFCLVACGGDKEETDAEKLLGEWAYSVDLSDAMSEVLSENLNDDSVAPDTALYMNLSLEFDDEEFTLTAEVDKESLDDYMDDLIDNMIDYLYDVAEDQGMTKEELEDKIEQEFGMSLNEYVREMMEQAIDGSIDKMRSEVSGYYKLDEKNGYIYIGRDEEELNSKKEAMEYSFSGKKLTISGIISDGEELDDPVGLKEYGVELPWKFEKK